MHKVLLVAAASLLVIVGAAPSLAAAPAQPASKPAAALKQTPQAKDLHAKAVDAAKKLKSFNYSAKVNSEGAPAPSYTGTVGAQKTEAGSWAMLVAGTTTAPDGKSRDVRVAYDGVTGRSLNDAEQSVTDSNVSSPDDVRLFFMSQDAGALMAWDLLAAEPLAAPSGAGLEIVGRGNAGGIDCKILQVTLPAKDNSPPELVHYFIPATDFLPRKIERVTTTGAGKTTQALELNDLKTDEKLAPSQFVLAVPDGYTVKAANKKAPKPPKPAPERPNQPQSDGLAIGAVAPSWKLKNADGVEKSLADYKGKVVVMDFWGTWCRPCVMAMPAIQKIHDKYKGKPVAVIGMNFEQRANADPAGFMKQKGFTYELMLKADKVLDSYKITGFPTLMVVGLDGKVVFVETGYSPELEQTLSKAIDDALVQ